MLISEEIKSLASAVLELCLSEGISKYLLFIYLLSILSRDRVTQEARPVGVLPYAYIHTYNLQQIRNKQLHTHTQN